MKRRLKIAALAAAVVGIAISEYEKNHPVYACYRFDSGGRLKKPVRFVFLTDLHEKSFGRGNRELLRMIDAVSPDAVLIGGDMPTAFRNRRRAYHRVSLALCRKLASSYPVYYGLGNHELKLSDDYMDKIAGLGIKVLDDETAQFMGVNLVGLTLPRSCYGKGRFERPDAKVVREKAGYIDPDRYTIMMAHSPNFLDEYALTGADLVLSGHFHGGTIRVNKDTGLMTPQYQFFNHNCHGIKHKDKTDMVISSGLGTHSVNIRINDRPEIVVVDIK